MNEEKLPLIVDLFSGCGGLAFGFKSSGFDIATGIEMSEHAASTASYNLYWRFGEDDHHIVGDVTKVESSKLKESIGNQSCIVIGGPPCQAYSLAGRSKLNSLGKDRAYMNDERGQLYKDFLAHALELNAEAIVMENVPEAVNYDGLNIPEHVCGILMENGYTASWTVLNAADYGVPQVRERVIVVALKEASNLQFEFPKPTHTGGAGIMGINQKKIIKRSSDYTFFTSPPSHSKETLNWVTVGEALSDLPSIFPDAKSAYKLYKPNVQMRYKSEPQNSYQHTMRNWLGKKTLAVSGHGFRKTVRDFKIFERMSQGDDYRNASAIADEILEETCRAMGIDPKTNIEDYQKIKDTIVPPYDRGKFHSKWRKLNEEVPSHTLVAHLSTDTYSHLHPWEPRGISVREAARLQSFPDSFLFQTPMSESFRQIGNAVPPLLSQAIANSLKKSFVREKVFL